MGLSRRDRSLEWLRQFAPFANGLPPHDRIPAVISRLNPKTLEEARWEVDEILSFNPHFNVAYLDYGFPMHDQSFRERFLDDLRRAGLPDLSRGAVD